MYLILSNGSSLKVVAERRRAGVGNLPFRGDLSGAIETAGALAICHVGNASLEDLKGAGGPDRDPRVCGVFRSRFHWTEIPDRDSQGG